MQPNLSNPIEETPVVFSLCFDLKASAFMLFAQKEDKPLPVYEALLKFNHPPFPTHIAESQDMLKIHPQDLNAVRSWLIRLGTDEPKQAICKLDRLTQSVKESGIPADCMLTVSGGMGNLSCAFPQSVIQLSNTGWLLSGDSLFQLPLGPATALSLRQSIFGHLLVDLLSHEIPKLRQSGIRISCPFRYDDSPYEFIDIREVTPDSVTIALNAVKELHPEPGTGGRYLWDGTTLRPYQRNSQLSSLFEHSDTTVLRGEAIADFALMAKGSLKPFTKGNIKQLFELHTVYEEAELVLVGYAEQHGGIGQALARVEVWTEGKRFFATVLSRSISADHAYIRTENGWLHKDLLEKIGLGPLGRLKDGRSIEKPFLLTPDELLTYGSERLQGPWKRMVVEGLHRCQEGQSRAYGHLRFLVEWGFNGGLAGNRAESIASLQKLLQEMAINVPQCHILIVGKRQILLEIIDGLSPLSYHLLEGTAYVDTQPGPIVLATANYMANNERFPREKVDLLVMIEPDALTRTSHTRIFFAMNRIRARVRIALYEDKEYRSRFETKFTQQTLLGMRGGFITTCLIIDCKKPLPPLPHPYIFTQDDLQPVQRFAEYEFPSESLTNRVYAIPPRTAQTSVTNYGAHALAGIGFQSSEKLFMEQAQKYAARTVKFATFVPFAAYWPTYESMTTAQSQWFFYWRDHVRHKDYPQTDLSYIFLYVYELINLVGCESPQQGYQKIMDVWRAYRPLYPRLDHYLSTWIGDFVLVHHLDVPKEGLSDMGGNSINATDLDRQLLLKLQETPLRLDISLLSKASNYDITRSKFYQSMYAPLCAEYIPKSVALVDAFLKKQQGRRILELFYPGEVQRERYLFQSALYAGEPRIVTINVVPVSSHPPLRDFFSQVVRYAENKLRDMKGFPGKLRGIELDEGLKRLIDGYIDRELNQKPAAQPRNIVIDVGKLARAAADAQQIQQMLTTDRIEEPSQIMENTPKKAGEEVSAASLPSKEKKGLLDSLSPMETVLLQLDEEGHGIIALLTRNVFEMDQYTLQASLPDCMIENAIDEINEKALQLLGSLLIVIEHESYLIDEDYRDELSYLQSHPRNGHWKQADMDFKGLNKEWEALMDRLSPNEREMLYAIAVGSDYMELQRIAEQVESLVEPVLDHINEAAMETIGDLLIEDRVILEEYLETVQQMFSEDT